jgi:hypothetical protein
MQMQMQPLAAFYIAAQVDERVTELISRVPEAFTKKVGLAGDKREATSDDVKNRALWLSVVAVLIGIAVAWVAKLALFQASGLTGLSAQTDYVLTGIALGGGTKPIHDAISYLQKASQKKGTASA